MTDQEITREVWKDHATLVSTSLERLFNEYVKERKKLNIAKESIYTRIYPIRTAAKNYWMVIIEKPPSVKRFKHKEDSACCMILYHYGPKGMVAYKPDKSSGSLFVYNPHFFSRYNERMKFQFNKSIEIVNHFFLHNCYCDYRIVKANNIAYGICNDGLLLGIYRPKLKWLVNRTFVSKDILYKKQKSLQDDILAFAKKRVTFNELLMADEIKMKRDNNIFMAITGQRKVG